MSIKGFSVNGAVEQYDYNALANKPTTTGLSDEAKQAILACFENVAWINEDGQTYVDALEAALYPPANLVSISAVYTQSGTVYDTDTLDSLKPDLVVTATYDNGTTATVTTYTLSGTLTEGTSTITVSYRGKATTFDVTVTKYMIFYDVDVSKLKAGYGNDGIAPNYCSVKSSRLSYPYFDLLIDGGKSYTFNAETTESGAQIGVQAFNQVALDAFNSGTSFSAANNDTIWDSGWQSLNVTLAIPSEVKSSPIVGVRFTFRKSTSDQSITSNFVTRMTIEEVTE